MLGRSPSIWARQRFRTSPSVLADAAAAALLAVVAPPPVLADATTAALLAAVAQPPVLADGSATALLAIAALPPVLAEAAAAAILAEAALPTVRTGGRHDFPCTPRSACLWMRLRKCARPVGYVWGVKTNGRHNLRLGR